MNTHKQNIIVQSFVQMNFDLLMQNQVSDIDLILMSQCPIHDYKLLGYAIANCRSVSDCDFVYKCLTQVSWPNEYIPQLNQMFNVITTQDQFIKTHLINGLMIGTTTETVDYKLHIVKALVEYGYPISFYELAVCINHDHKGFVLSDVIPAIDDMDVLEDKDSGFFLSMIMPNLLNHNRVDYFIALLMILSEHDVVFNLGDFIEYHKCNELTNFLYTKYLMIIQNHVQKHEEEDNDNDCSDGEEGQEPSKKCCFDKSI